MHNSLLLRQLAAEAESLRNALRQQAAEATQELDPYTNDEQAE
jgi:hypothetical protein